MSQPQGKSSPSQRLPAGLALRLLPKRIRPQAGSVKIPLLDFAFASLLATLFAFPLLWPDIEEPISPLPLVLLQLAWILSLAVFLQWTLQGTSALCLRTHLRSPADRFASALAIGALPATVLILLSPPPLGEALFHHHLISFFVAPFVFLVIYPSLLLLQDILRRIPRTPQPLLDSKGTQARSTILWTLATGTIIGTVSLLSVLAYLTPSFLPVAAATVAAHARTRTGWIISAAATTGAWLLAAGIHLESPHQVFQKVPL